MAKYQILDLFYKSKDWIQFRDAYISLRLSEDGGSMCDYCGQFIDKADDVTLHHIEELTPTNVCDFSVALDPANIKQVHKACHNAIHKHAGELSRRVYIVYGPPMAGMDRYVRRRAWPGDLVIDIDEIYRAITLLPLHEKPDTIFLNAVAIQNLLIDQVKTRYGRWDNAWIVGGYPDKYKREKLGKELGAEVIYMEASRDECIQRVKQDPMTRDKEQRWIGYIDKWFDKHTG